MSVSSSPNVGPHIHTFTLSRSEIKTILEGGTVDVTTSIMASHSHNIRVEYDLGRDRCKL